MPDRDVRLRLLVEAVDKATNKIKDIASSLLGVKSQSDKVNASTTKMGNEGAASMQKMANAAKGMKEGFEKASAAADKMAQVGRSLITAGAVLGGAAFFPVKAAATFERSMSRVRAVTKGTEEDFFNIEKAAKKMGRETQFTASQAADGVKFLGLAGLDAKEALLALEPTLNLAAAGELSMAEAADYATNIQLAFGRSLEELPHIMDALAYTAANSNTDVRQLAEAMKYVAPVARLAGVSLENASATIGVLSSNGIQASMAGTVMRGMIASLVKPSTEAEVAMKSLGVEVKFLKDGSLDLAGTMEELDKAGMSAADAFAIFRRTGASGAAAISKSIPLLRSFSKEVNEADGAAGQMRKTIEDNLQGAFTRFTSALDGLLTAMGTPLLGAFAKILDSVSSVINKISEWATANPKVSSTLILITGALGGLLAVLGAVLIPLGLILKAFFSLGGTFATALTYLPKVASGFATVTTAIKGMTLAIAALKLVSFIGVVLASATAVWKAVEAFEAMRDSMKMLDEQQKKITASATVMMDKYKEFKNIADTLDTSNLMGKTGDQLENLRADIYKGISYWQAYKNTLLKTSQETTSVFSNILTEEARQAKAEIERAEEEIKRLNKLRGVVAAEKDARNATAGLGDIDVQALDAQRKASEASLKLTQEEIDARLKLQQDARDMEIALMEDGIAKINALREVEKETFLDTEDAKNAGAEERQKVLVAIDAKYAKQRSDFLEAKAKEASATQIALSEANVELIQAQNDRILKEYDRQYEKGQLSLTDYFEKRKEITIAGIDAEISVLQEKLKNASDSDKNLIEVEIKVKQEGLQAELSEHAALMEEFRANELEKERYFQEQLAEIRSQTKAGDATQDPYALEMEQYDRQQEEKLQAFANAGASIDQLDAYYSELQIQRRQKLKDMQDTINEQQLQGTIDTLGGMSQAFGDVYEASGKKMKEFFYLQKAASIAQTIMSTYQGAQEAYKAMSGIPYVGPALGAAAAAAAIVSGIARVAMIRSQSLATGGKVKGWSPNKRADNVPINATAGEFMMPVDSVKKYGLNIMEGIRKGMFPVEMFRGYTPTSISVPPSAYHLASGGQVPAPSAATQSGSAQTQQPNITIMNYTDRNEMLAALASPEGHGAIVNAISSERESVSRVLR